MNRKGILTTLLLASSFTAAAATPAWADPPPLLSRDLLFGNPERAAPHISPDGKRLAWLAPDKKNVLQVWVKTIGKNDDKMVTADKKRGIRTYFFAEDDRTLLYQQDADGDENFHVYGVDLVDGNVRDYTPFQGVRGGVEDTNHERPNEILVSLNLRSRQTMDVYRCDLRTGALVLDTENPGDVVGWVTDTHMNVRGAQVSLADGGTELRVRDDAKAPWRSLLKASMEENVGFLGFTPNGKSVYLESSLGNDTTRFIERDLASGNDKVIADRPDVDVGGVWIHPYTHLPVAAAFAHGRQEWQALDPAVKGDLAALKKVLDADFGITSQDRADKTWLVSYTQDRGPVRYYTYDRASKKATFLFSSRPKLDGAKLSEMKSYTIPARDGLKLPVYVTLPAGYAGKKLPMVLACTAARGGATVGLQPRGAVAGQSRLRGGAGELPRLDGLRQEVPARRRQAVGQGHAHRPARRRRLGGQAGLGRSQARRHLRRLVRRLRGARRRRLHARRLQVRRRHRRPVEPLHAAEDDPAVLEADDLALLHAHGRPEKDKELVARRLAAVLGGQDSPSRCSSARARTIRASIRRSRSRSWRRWRRTASTRSTSSTATRATASRGRRTASTSTARREVPLGAARWARRADDRRQGPRLDGDGARGRQEAVGRAAARVSVRSARNHWLCCSFS